MSSEPQRDCPPPIRATAPKQRLPEGTTDCHCHVFENPARYPLAGGRSYTPPLCGIDDYVAMCHTLGITRTVQVNASVYGFDNSVTLDLIARLGQDKARGDVFCDWVPDEKVRRQILVVNPARLYGFDSSA